MSFTYLAKTALSRTALGDVLRRIPGLSAFYTRYALARRDHFGIFAGIYPSYDAAIAAIPPARQAGWDNQDSSSMWNEHVDPIRPSTYPLLFWLSRLLHNGAVLSDFGGSVGLTYYGCRRMAVLPASMRWQVVEVPTIAEAGRRIAEREAAPDLSFSNNFDDLKPCEILLSAGALQYMPKSVPGLLDIVGHHPSHILLNKLPLYSGPSYWSLQNFGPAVCPYQIYNEREFLGYFESAGYVLRDRWSVTELSCDIPFYPKFRVPEFCGMYWQHQNLPIKFSSGARTNQRATDHLG